MRNGILEPNSRNSKSASLSWSDAEGLNQVGNVHRHLINGGVVELLDVSHQANVIVCNKVYSYSLSAKSTTASNPERNHNSFLTVQQGRFKLVYRNTAYLPEHKSPFLHN